MGNSLPLPLHVIEAKPRIAGVRVGRLAAADGGWSPLVDFPGNPIGPHRARVAAGVSLDQLHSNALLLLFEDNDPARPLVIGVLRNAASSAIEPLPAPDAPCAGASVRSTWPQNNLSAVRIAAIAEVRDDRVLIAGDDGVAPVVARTAVALRNLRDPVLVLTLTDGEAVILGQLLPKVEIAPEGGADADVVLKGSKVLIEADVELLFRAGGCEIRLEALGKLSSTAEHIVSRARGANKVQGGSVQLN